MKKAKKVRYHLLKTFARLRKVVILTLNVTSNMLIVFVTYLQSTQGQLSLPSLRGQ